MKNYIKPTFTLAGLFPVAFAAGGCANDIADAKEILAALDHEYTSDTFAVGEECKDQVDIDIYCKFSLQESGLIAILGS